MKFVNSTDGAYSCIYGVFIAADPERLGSTKNAYSRNSYTSILPPIIENDLVF